MNKFSNNLNASRFLVINEVIFTRDDKKKVAIIQLSHYSLFKRNTYIITQHALG